MSGVDISLSELRAWNSTIKAGQDRRHCSLEVMLPWIVRYRLAILVYSVLACEQFLMLMVSSLNLSNLLFSSILVALKNV